MSSAISSTYSSLDRTIASIGSLQAQIATLQEQTSTGKISQSYAGIASAAPQVLDLTAAQSRATTYQQVISSAQGKASVIQDVLGQIGSIVTSVSNAALALGTSPSSTVTAVSQQAQQAFTQVASLLNTQYAGQYLFSGEDSGNPPVPNAASATSSGLYTQIGAQVNALATSPSSPPLNTVIANTVAIAGSTSPATSPFSTYLNGAGAGAAPAKVAISDTQSIDLGVTASTNLQGIASDPSIGGTGSAIRDILRGLAVVANSTSAISSSSDFPALIQNATATLRSASSTLTEESGAIGQRQETLTSAASENSSFQLLLAKQVSGLTDVDAAATISNLQEVSNQLQASYKVLSLASSLTLASYL